MHLLNLRKYGFLLVVLFASACIMISCGDEDEPGDTCETTGLTYDNYAKDFLASNCVSSGCHDADGINTIGSYETYEDTKTAFEFGRVKGAINHEDGFSNMPKGGTKLDDCSIDKLSAWIDAGLPE
ncbi:MAG: hypothetical protein P1U56_11220 [Saprospiraceae bacterium]|nr:hypothetical protein [Saprospiraceae bacterium]